MNILTSALCLGLSAFVGTAAFANDPAQNPITAPGNEGFTKWGESADWTVLIDNQRKTCLVEKFDAAGNAVQIGLGGKGKRAYFGVFTKLPEELRGLGKDQRITVELNGKEVHSARVKVAHRKKYAEYSGTYLPAQDMDFAKMSSNPKQTLKFPGRDIEVEFNVDGAEEAIVAAKACFAEVRPASQ